MLTTTRRIAALTTALALLLAACSSGDEAAAPEPSPSTTQAEPEPTREVETEPDADKQASDLGPLSEEEADAVRDMLGVVEYADSADEATCDAMFGEREDSITNLLLNSVGATNAEEALAVVSTTTATIDEYAAAAPAEVRGHFESLSDTVARLATVQDMTEAQQLATDTEATVNTIAAYCFE